jgi:hypothetical protein
MMAIVRAGRVSLVTKNDGHLTALTALTALTVLTALTAWVLSIHRTCSEAR